MTLLDNYFPFDAGPGTIANHFRWRQMARLWFPSGVISGYLNQLAPVLSGSNVTIDTGGVWVDGFYGENTVGLKTIAWSGNGYIVARLDPVNQTITFNWVTAITQNPTSLWDISLASITSGVLTDTRSFIYQATGVGVPPGSMMDYAGSAAPTGWLLCDGTSYLRATYPALFTAIGTTWGAADGSHFNVPDLRSRMPVFAGAGAGLTSRTLAATGGEETHALTVAEEAVHSHTDAGHSHGDPGHNHGATSTESAYHNHNMATSVGGAVGSSYTIVGGAGSYTIGNNNQLHTHGTGTVGAGLYAANVGVQNAGSGTAHNNMPPFVVVTKIIRT